MRDFCRDRFRAIYIEMRVNYTYTHTDIHVYTWLRHRQSTGVYMAFWISQIPNTHRMNHISAAMNVYTPN